jgi:hypothetical protein
MVPVEKARRSQGPDAAWRRTDIAVTMRSLPVGGGSVELRTRRGAMRLGSGVMVPNVTQLGGGVKVLTQWRRGLNRVQISAA